MFLQSTFSKLALAAATGALALATAATPALAATPTAAPEKNASAEARPHYKGRVIAKSGLLIRSGPSQKHKVVGALPYGTVVNIVCKVNGQNIDGNPRWYLLSNGKWAWGAARYIVNIGAAPHWC
ncbi:SH3 domain-containing protein [Streptomyces buecherae]|uniref:SH3 domain-containing protein n=1 Tax=Streptomyces buecherae TaxID=2763006 RepID=UPI0037A65382